MYSLGYKFYCSSTIYFPNRTQFSICKYISKKLNVKNIFNLKKYKFSFKVMRAVVQPSALVISSLIPGDQGIN